MSQAESDTEWVSATSTRNHVLDNPLLDWLDQHGESKGFERDRIDGRTDFGLFVMRKGIAFETAVMRHLRSLVPVPEIATIDESAGDDQAEATIEAMSEGVPLICQSRLIDSEAMTFGRPDLLVRSDALSRLFSDVPVMDEASRFGEWHYVVVDIKYSTLHLNAAGELDNTGSAPAYKTQLFIYNRALAAIQGYLPPQAFVLGRGWEQRRKGEKVRGDNCMDRLGAVPHNGTIANKVPISVAADAAVEWLRRVRNEGATWEALPEPSVPELRPSAQGKSGEWAGAVNQIVAASQDLTSLYYVTPKGRDVAAANGITRWSDPRATPALLNVNGPVTSARLQAILDANQAAGPPVIPATVNAARAEWIEPDPLEFYIDFETVNDLDDRFDTIPDKGGQPLIFMVGCGHLDGDAWRFKCFVADDLTVQSEADMIDRWMRYMSLVAASRGLEGRTPRAIHWSNHEPSSLSEASKRSSHAAESWTKIDWFDFLTRVMQSEPVAVRGAHAFGLKVVANAMCDLGLIDTRWGSGPADGQGAMVGAWWCQRKLEQGAGRRLPDLKLMSEIEDYNEVDCKAMMEIVRYLRHNH